MIVLGLTGSIGMGKTTAGKLLRGMGVPVHDADEAVHRLMAPGGAAVAAVAAAFPAARKGNAIDRAVLRDAVRADPAGFKTLEAILHPLVRADAERFLAKHARNGRKVVVLDIPLLFETHAEDRVDRVIAVSAPAFLQEARVLRRPGTSPAWLAVVRARQTPDREKRRRADDVVLSAHGKQNARRALARIVAAARRMPPRVWRPGAPWRRRRG
jgi:dephospho-CoA kinase